jgi:hypothetical protein
MKDRIIQLFKESTALYNPGADTDDVLDYMEKNAIAFEKFKTASRNKTVQASNEEQTFIIHRSTRTGVENWQITTFENGKPVGHETHETWDQAIDNIEDDVDWAETSNYKIGLRESLNENAIDEYVYHGTVRNSAKNIIQNGIDMKYSALGYFGQGFYTTPDASLAKSNYADFADDEDEPGVVLKFKVDPSSNVLDMRKEEDWLKWRDGKYRGVKYTDLIHRPEFASIMQSEGIDGLYDESFGGWVFYNPNVLQVVEN